MVTKTEQIEQERKEIRIKKILYYIEEFTILLVTLLAVVCGDAIIKRASGEFASFGDLLIDPFNLIISGILALMCYGYMFTKFKYSDNKKPPLIKRIATAIMNGIAWRTIYSLTK